jgi:hypothetical protein
MTHTSTLVRNSQTGAHHPQSVGGLTLPPRWTTLKYHRKQAALWVDPARFKVVSAGRRSGKTELAKRKLVLKAITFCDFDDGRFICGAPTLPQAKQIYWEDLKRLVPKWALSKSHGREPIKETTSTIWLWNGAHIQVVGMDRPERVEGSPVDGIVLDEYGNMKEVAWTLHVRPAVSTLGREGWAWLIGVPEGRNHYYDIAMMAKGLQNEEWSFYTWYSSTVLDPKEIEAAKRELDDLVYKQEYEGSFVSFEGLAYYNFDREIHGCEDLSGYYNNEAPLAFCFDFNVQPGTAAVAQESIYLGRIGSLAREFTAVLGEVHIPRNSTTPAVCRKLIHDWGHHKGIITCYGDATGGSRGTAKVHGSDWDLIRDELRPVFGDRLRFDVPKSNPSERARVNAINTRLRNASGVTRMLIDPSCTYLIKDFEGVSLLQGGSGEIDKKKDPALTHLSDALGYYIERKHSTTQSFLVRQDL